jgi:hypothetical protein
LAAGNIFPFFPVYRILDCPIPLTTMALRASRDPVESESLCVRVRCRTDRSGNRQRCGNARSRKHHGAALERNHLGFLCLGCPPAKRSSSALLSLWPCIVSIPVQRSRPATPSRRGLPRACPGPTGRWRVPPVVFPSGAGAKLPGRSEFHPPVHFADDSLRPARGTIALADSVPNKACASKHKSHRVRLPGSEFPSR